MSDNLTAIWLSFSNHLINGLVALLLVIGPLWLILHYLIKFRGNRHHNAADAQAFEALSRTASRMEQRMLMLERILDAELPHWRQSSDPGVHDHEHI